MKPFGRPRKELNIKEFEKLCGLQCTKEEIAGFFEMNQDTLETRIKETYGLTFSEVFKQKRGNGKIALRRKQWHIADKSAAMAIFLGKNYLGQKDSQEIDGNFKVERAFDVTKMDKEEYKKHIAEQVAPIIQSRESKRNQSENE